MATYILLTIIACIAHAVFSYLQYPNTEEKGPYKTPWRPLESVTVTVAIYFISSVLATYTLYDLLGPLVVQESGRENSTVVNFVYLLIFESLTVLLLVGFLLRRKARLRSLGVRQPRSLDVAYAAFGFVIYYIALSLSEKLLPWIDFEQKQEIGFSSAVGDTGLVVVFFSLVIMVPIVEELIMRGFLYSGLRSRLRILPAAIITSVLFAVAHLQAGNGNPLLWVAAVDTFLLSIILVGLREATKSLTAPIMLHMLKNGIAFTYLFVIPRLT